jgi:hypothetical protein
MPTKEQMNRVANEIEILTGGLEVVRAEEKHAIPASDGRTVLFWADLVGDHRRDALGTAINWEGFSEVQKDSVMQRVLDGECADFWMDDVKADNAPDVAAGRNRTDELIADFHSRIEELKRDGVPDFPPLGNRLPWAEASEERKLENIVWESMSVWPDAGDLIDIPDVVRLEAVEQNIDYAKLPEDLRTALQGLRFAPEGTIAAELERITGMEYDANDHDFEEQTEPLDVKDRIEQLERVYEVHGRDGMKDHSDGDVRLLLSAKQIELGAISERLESRNGSGLDVLLKDQLESGVRELGGELVVRSGNDSPISDREKFSRILNGPSMPAPSQQPEQERSRDR